MAAAVTVREARPEDADAIARIHVESWRVAYHGVVPASFLAELSVDERAAHWRDAFAHRPQRLVHVAQVEGAVVGFAAAGPARDDDAAELEGELYAIYVDPSWWRQGAGRSLEQASIAGLRAAGFAAAMLWVLAHNLPARTFYETCGWAFDGTRSTIALGGGDVSIVRYRRPLA